LAALEPINDVSKVTRQKFYVKHIYTHADYDVANAWYARNKGVKR
jgi:mRNA interferase HigB